VAAWGGDGTINEVASALVFSETCLAIVPGGSGNGLARDLGVPLDSTAALELAATGSRKLIDAGQIDDSWFFNVAGSGWTRGSRSTSPGRARGAPFGLRADHVRGTAPVPRPAVHHRTQRHVGQLSCADHRGGQFEAVR